MDKLKAFLCNFVKIAKEVVPPIHPEGRFFVTAAGVITFAVIYASDFGFISWIFLLLTAWVAYFFRDPVRVTPVGDDLVISPADGKVHKIEQAVAPEELGLDKKERTKISIFLNVFDVHVNRAPVSGEVTLLNYRPGKFLSANLDKASIDNERQSMVIKTKDDKEVVCVQIAGQVARRIVCDAVEGQAVNAGQRYGIIRFGSRADIYLPEGVKALVVEGQYVLGGESIIAKLSGKQTARKGEVR